MMYYCSWVAFYNSFFLFFVYYVFLFLMLYISLSSATLLYGFTAALLYTWRAPAILFFNHLLFLHSSTYFVFILLGSFLFLCLMSWAVRLQYQNTLFAFIFIQVGFFLFMTTAILLIFFFIELLSLLMFILLINTFFGGLASDSAQRTAYWFNNTLLILFWVSLFASLLLFMGLTYFIIDAASAHVSVPLLGFFVAGLFLKMGLPPLFLWKVDFMRGLHVAFLLFYILIYYFLNVLFLFFFIINNIFISSIVFCLAFVAFTSFLTLISSLQDVSSLFIFFALSSLINACVVFVITLLIISRSVV